MRTAVRFVEAMVLAATLLMMTACGSDEKDPVTTNAVARQQIINYLQHTVDGLPWPATLSQTLPGGAGMKLSPSPLPCDLDDGNPEQPYAWTYQLWLLLPAGTTPGDARAQTASVWRSLGFNVSSTDSVVRATTDDGYKLSAQAAVDGIPVGVQSPCFPKSQLDRTQPWPDRITSSD